MELNENKMQQALTTDTELVIDRIFNSHVTNVRQAWTEVESIQKWWGPKDYTCPHAFIDFREGGKYLSCMRSPQGDEFWSTGSYKEIIPYQKIVCTDSFSDKDGNVIPASDLKMPGNWPSELLVTVTFEEAKGKTIMKLRHQGLPPEILDDCKTGWEQSLDKLEENLS